MPATGEIYLAQPSPEQVTANQLSAQLHAAHMKRHEAGISGSRSLGSYGDEEERRTTYWLKGSQQITSIDFPSDGYRVDTTFYTPAEKGAVPRHDWYSVITVEVGKSAQKYRINRDGTINVDGIDLKSSHVAPIDPEMEAKIRDIIRLGDVDISPPERVVSEKTRENIGRTASLLGRIKAFWNGE